MFESARAAGRRILHLVRDQLLPRKILTAAAFENAVRVAVAIGASINTVRHLAATATEADLDVDIIRMIEACGGDTPQIAQIKPNGPDRIEDLDKAGGTRAIQWQLRSLLHTGVLTVAGETLGSALDREIHVNQEIVRPVADPFHAEPGLIVLRGNLAPDGAIVKLSAVPGSVHEFAGPARVFDDEDVAMQRLHENAIHPGDVVVLRMMGPVGGPGTVFACSFMAALVGAGLASSVAVVTDGELSGLNRGITVGQVMPEAACGGPLAVVKENDLIRIDLHARTLELEVTATELKRRLEAWSFPPRDLKPGWLSLYAELVQPLSKGAVLGKRTLTRS
jgi:dihydroxy-acid dehydratase